jgi:hypothetical protein
VFLEINEASVASLGNDDVHDLVMQVAGFRLAVAGIADRLERLATGV